MTQDTTKQPQSKSMRYSIRVEIEGSETYCIPYESFDRLERDLMLIQVDEQVESGKRVIKFGQERILAHLIVRYHPHDYTLESNAWAYGDVDNG